MSMVDAPSCLDLVTTCFGFPATNMASTLILGCGKLGYPLGKLLTQEGHRVIGVRRSKAPDDPADIEWLALDVRDQDARSLLPQDVDQIIVILTPATRSPEGYRSIYQQGLENVLSLYERSSRRPACIFVSATSVYAQDRGEWVDEKSICNPSSYNGESLLAAESRILGFSDRALIIRFSGIYGAERRRLISKLEQPIDIQKTPPTYTNRIHQHDCVGVLRHFAKKQLNGEALHSIYIATDHDCAPKYEMMSWLAAEAGLVPPTPFDAGGDARQNKRCRNQRLLDSGYRFLFPSYKEGYRAMLTEH